jgi:Prp8 binding protein
LRSFTLVLMRSFCRTGHTDTISGLSVSPSGSHLLSSSFDNTVRIWDIRPFAPVANPGQTTSPRLHRTLLGAPAGFDSQLRKPAWEPSGERVAVGGADRSVTIWDVESAQVR